MRRPRVTVTADAELAIASMSLAERDLWGRRIERLIARGAMPGARKIRGTRGLYRLRTETWTLLYGRAPSGRSFVIVSLALRRSEEAMEAAFSAPARAMARAKA
jgi:hypothetical protein